MSTTNTRVATTQDGKSYVVNHIDFGSSRAPLADPVVRCWGEVVSSRGASRKHAGSKAFLQSVVTITEVDGGVALSVKLFAQANAQAERGALPGYVDVATAKGQRSAHRRAVNVAVRALRDGDAAGFCRAFGLA